VTRDTDRDAFAVLVATARKRCAVGFASAGFDFDEACWDIRALKDRTANSASPRLHFTRHGSTDDPLPPALALAVKSWLILDYGSAGSMGLRLDSVRMLWEAIRSRRKQDGRFRWEDLCLEDLSQAELLMREQWSASTVNKRIINVIGFTEFLAANGVARALYYRPQTPRIEDFNRHTIAGQQERRDRLPTEAALLGLADIYRELATEPRDRLRIAAIAILMVTGLRIGELLTMPVDCEVEESRAGKPRYGLRYFREKSRGGARMFAVRWLTATGAELARSAIAEIRDLTNAARLRAQALERTPQRVPIPGYHWAARMSAAEVSKTIGLLYPPSRIPRHVDGRGAFYRASEVEKYLLSLRAPRLWTIDKRDGTFQMFSESLLVTFRHFFHPYHADFPLLVEPVVIQDISDFLSGRGDIRSVFERFDIREPDGSFCRVTSHQFRHWLNYIADKGGLPVDLQTRWFGRENPRDTEAYRHATADERLAWVKEGIRDGQLSGVKADAFFELPRTKRGVFLEAEIQAVHITAFGLCLHDFAVTPCQYHLNCVRGCPDYLRTKGNSAERDHLVQIQLATERALAGAKARGDVAQAWVDHYEQTLTGIRQALAVDGDSASADGALVRPFPKGKRR
jgi:integrase